MEGDDVRKQIGAVLLGLQAAAQHMMNVYEPLSFPQMLKQRTIGEARAQLMMAKSELELSMISIRHLDIMLGAIRPARDDNSGL